MKIKYTILDKHNFFIFTNRKYGLLTLYKILDSKVHPIISKDNQRLPKTAKDSQARLVFPDALSQSKNVSQGNKSSHV